MLHDPPLTVKFYRTDSGNEPVREWLKELSVDDKKTIGRDIKTVQMTFPESPSILSPLGDGLWEIKSGLGSNRISRVIFTVHNNQVVILQGFIKKTRKIPKRYLDLAKKRKSVFKKG
jgi:phage-related protein